MTIKEQTLYYLLQEQGYSHGATVTAMQILTQSREAMDDAIVFVDEKRPTENEFVEYIEPNYALYYERNEKTKRQRKVF